MHSVASTDGLAACHVCKRGFIWLMWATGQDNLPCSVKRGPRGTAGWRARERLWFISAPGTHLVGLVQGCGTRGKWEAAGVLPVSWASGVIARRGVRVAAAEVDIYIMTLCARGRKWNRGSAETLSFPPTAAHGRLQRGDMGRASAAYGQACAETDAPGSSLGCQSQGSAARSQRPPPPWCSQLRPPFSLHLAPLYDGERSAVLLSFAGMLWGCMR